jgi:hypothetical protein
MPYRHVKVLVKEGAHSFIQGEEKKKPAANSKYCMYNVNNEFNEYNCNNGYNIINTPQNKSRTLCPVLA